MGRIDVVGGGGGDDVCAGEIFASAEDISAVVISCGGAEELRKIEIAKSGRRAFTIPRMSDQRAASWQDLFAGGDGPTAVVDVRIIMRGGQPFLVLPADSRAAARGLELYSAQTAKARVAKVLLKLALGWGLPVGLARGSVTVHLKAAFAEFLTKMGGGSGFPRLAILLGNPKAEGRRFVVMVFDARNQPSAVIKAGVGEDAIRLIEHEGAFLESAPQKTAGVPRLRGIFRSERLQALALDFMEGHSPSGEECRGMEELLSSWIDTGRTISFGELPAWRRLVSSGGAQLAGWAVWGELQGGRCHPVIYHGDFAPWNIKIVGGVWRVLDWERGELAGVPGWDWFHYVIQSAVLVRREEAGGLAARVERMLASEAFKRYAAKAGIEGMERALVLAYLNYSIRILKQTERLPLVQALLNRLAEKKAD